MAVLLFGVVVGAVPAVGCMGVEARAGWSAKVQTHQHCSRLRPPDPGHASNPHALCKLTMIVCSRLRPPDPEHLPATLMLSMLLLLLILLLLLMLLASHPCRCKIILSC